MLRISLVVGALHDLLLALFVLRILGLPDPVEALLAPAPSLLLHLTALLLAMLALLYLAGARDPRRYSAVIVVASLGRWLAAVALGLHGARHPELTVVWPLAMIQLVLGTTHAGLWVRQR